jgi:hypothetical protein
MNHSRSFSESRFDKANKHVKRKAAKLRSWRVAVLRHRAEYLGNVQARDERAAEAAAVAQFNLDPERASAW